MAVAAPSEDGKIDGTVPCTMPSRNVQHGVVIMSTGSDGLMAVTVTPATVCALLRTTLPAPAVNVPTDMIVAPPAAASVSPACGVPVQPLGSHARGSGPCPAVGERMAVKVVCHKIDAGRREWVGFDPGRIHALACPERTQRRAEGVVSDACQIGRACTGAC